MNFPIPRSEEWLLLSARVDSGLGWILILSLCIAVTLLWVSRRWTIPHWQPLNIPLSPLAVGIIALLVRLPHLFDSLWYDETFTAAMVRVPLNQLPTAILSDVHPPLNYLIQWFTARLLGTSEVALRIPSLLFGLALVWLVYRLALALGLERRVALNSALLVALLPAGIYYSNEARAYSLLACLAVGALIALLEKRAWVFMVCLGSLPHVHNLGYIHFAVIVGVAVFWERDLRRWWVYLGAGIIAGVWLPFMLQQAGDVSNGFWIPPQTLPGAFWYIPDMTLSLRLSEMYVLPTYIPMLVVSLIALWSVRQWLQGHNRWVYLSFVFVPSLLVSVVSALWHPIHLSRAFLACGLVLSIGWAYLMTRHRLYQFTILGFVGLALVGYQFTGQRSNLRGAFSSCGDSDYAYYTGLPAQFMGGYYLDIPSLLWPQANDLNQTLPEGGKRAFGFEQGHIKQLSGGVCLVQVVTPYTDPTEWGYVLQTLDDYPHESFKFKFNNVFHLYIHRLEVYER